jgi:hypothetical protein
VAAVKKDPKKPSTTQSQGELKYAKKQAFEKQSKAIWDYEAKMKETEDNILSQGDSHKKAPSSYSKSNSGINQALLGNGYQSLRSQGALRHFKLSESNPSEQAKDQKPLDLKKHMTQREQRTRILLPGQPKNETKLPELNETA